ncbi:MAG TPA: DMT family transporter [Ignavibacteriales bacterium]|nr:DMT family transporter [Ignavibacteriales bacterium]
MKKFTGEGGLLLVTLIWGGTFVIVKSSINDASPVLFVALRFLIAALVFAAVMNAKLFEIKKRTLIVGIILGTILFLEFALQTVGLKYTSATKSAFITGSFIIFTPIVQALRSKKLPASGSLIGACLALIGLVLLSSNGTDIRGVFAELGSSFNFGDFLTLGSALALSIYLVYLSEESGKNDYMELTFMQLATTGVIAIIAASAFNLYDIETVHFTFTDNLIFGLAYTSLLATLLTTILHTKFQKFVSPTKTSIIFCFEPVFAAVFAYIALNETISVFGLLGGAFMFAGFLVSELYDSLSKKGKGRNDIIAES